MKPPSSPPFRPGKSSPRWTSTTRSRCLADHPFRASDHTVLTPHLGYGVAETWRAFYPQSVENAEAFLDGKPIRVLNPP